MSPDSPERIVNRALIKSDKTMPQRTIVVLSRLLSTLVARAIAAITVIMAKNVPNTARVSPPKAVIPESDNQSRSERSSRRNSEGVWGSERVFKHRLHNSSACR